jgi:predicted nucleic acid-binding protein
VILVDTSIWIDHLRAGDATQSTLLEQGDVVVHPWVTGELALGTLADRDEILDLLGNQPQAVVASDDEILHLIGSHALHRSGIGYVDAQLLAATLLTPGTRLWTRDQRLAQVSTRLGIRRRGGSVQRTGGPARR